MRVLNAWFEIHGRMHPRGGAGLGEGCPWVTVNCAVSLSPN